jgi:hypothetical protein
MAHFKSEGGVFYTGPSASGPWTRKSLAESVQRPQPARPHKEKTIMGKSGFDRALEEQEKRRRRLREDSKAQPLDLDVDELDQLYAEWKEYVQAGKGENGEALTIPEAGRRFVEMLSDAHVEPTEADEAMEQFTGRRAAGRRRLRAGESKVSPDEFRQRLMEDDGTRFPRY